MLLLPNARSKIVVGGGYFVMLYAIAAHKLLFDKGRQNVSNQDLSLLHGYVFPSVNFAAEMNDVALGNF